MFFERLDEQGEGRRRFLPHLGDNCPDILHVSVQSGQTRDGRKFCFLFVIGPFRILHPRHFPVGRVYFERLVRVLFFGRESFHT